MKTATAGLTPNHTIRIGPITVLGMMLRKTMTGNSPRSSVPTEMIASANGTATSTAMPKPSAIDTDVAQACANTVVRSATRRARKSDGLGRI